MTRPGPSAVLRHRALGVIFALLLLAGVWLTYAVFDKAFVDVVHVSVRTDRVGLQLPVHADVKVRGVLVGEVRSISSTGDGARLDLALSPGEVGSIPRNVSARILPKTLFGEKYVELEIPVDASSTSIAAGDVIRQSSVSMEVEQVLSDTYPLLTAVEPVQLSYTLNALSTALEGRGDRLGDGLVRLDGYLKQLNPLVPSIVRDLGLLSKVSAEYRAVLPDLAATLDNSVVTGDTVVGRRQELAALFDDVAGLSSTTRDFLQANGDNIIRLGEVQLPTTQLLAEYAPEYPCLTEGMANWIPRMSQAYRDYTLHITLETLPSQPTGYSRADDPVYGADNGPHCETLPNPPYSQANPGPQPPPGEVKDGVDSTHGKYRPAPGYDLTSGYAGTAAEQQVVDAVAGPVLKTQPDQVPDIATLLLGPIARGTEVSLR
jgi:phospholipid/cholesterol/gamma-HCH transport system substrate-binding protein